MFAASAPEPTATIMARAIAVLVNMVGFLVELSLVRIFCVADALGKSACGLAERARSMTGRSKKSLSGRHIGASHNCGNKMRWSRY